MKPCRVYIVLSEIISYLQLFICLYVWYVQYM